MSSHHHHDTYWQQEKRIDFFDYERNPALIPFIQPGEMILDLGCGDGAVGEYLVHQCQCRVYGLDFSQTALRRASQRGIIPVAADTDQPLPFQTASFDLVFFGDVIEHIYHPDQAVAEISRVLKPGGRLLVSCPNMGYWRYRLHYLLHGMFPETEWIEANLWESQHIRFFYQTLLNQLLLRHHLTPRSFVGISRRRLDQPLLRYLPAWFGMIMLVEAVK